MIKKPQPEGGRPLIQEEKLKKITKGEGTMSKKLRVIQFGTGFVGHFALRAIIEHPDMELVGCWVYSDDKVGVDAGDIAGTEKTGILTTNDIDALLTRNADCLCSGAGGDGR
ncbi:MAG: hypothetical protein KJO26_15650, partial [Deltaproteobacteria bacterium]|nr:hypothetical protein [Deltaproteobacteria bacterium]